MFIKFHDFNVRYKHSFFRMRTSASKYVHEMIDDVTRRPSHKASLRADACHLASAMSVVITVVVTANSVRLSILMR